MALRVGDTGGRPRAACAAWPRPPACAAPARSWPGSPPTPRSTRSASGRSGPAAAAARAASTTSRRSTAACSRTTPRRPRRRSCWCTAWSTTGRSSRCCAGRCAAAASARSVRSTTACSPPISGRRRSASARRSRRSAPRPGTTGCTSSRTRLGGVVARYHVQRQGGDARVHTLVTLGAPHGGTGRRRVLPLRLCRQLRPDSDVIAELAEPAAGCRTRFLAVWSDLDQLIYPKPTPGSSTPTWPRRTCWCAASGTCRCRPTRRSPAP